jgi:hypothetical protein
MHTHAQHALDTRTLMSAALKQGGPSSMLSMMIAIITV